MLIREKERKKEGEKESKREGERKTAFFGFPIRRRTRASRAREIGSRNLEQEIRQVYSSERSCRQAIPESSSGPGLRFTNPEDG
jgi:hypothetical protein